MTPAYLVCLPFREGKFIVALKINLSFRISLVLLNAKLDNTLIHVLFAKIVLMDVEFA